MAQRIPIQLHVANALQWLGTLYRSPADALKEHVSNAIDEHVKAQAAGAALARCGIVFTLDRRSVTVEYPYGMTRAEFETALQRVANSAKRSGTARTIGRLGIGIFGFQQIGRRCTFFSRKSMASDTVRVVLTEGSDEASIETALARERLTAPGLRVVISDLKFDPTRPRGPLAPDVLRRYLAEKVDGYLREGWLAIEIRSGVAKFSVTPPPITLPRLLSELRQMPVNGDARRALRLDVYFDPSGRGQVAVRHRGVTVVDSLAATSAYGVEDSAWAGGFVRGTIEADFLTPLPARSGFEEDTDWIAFLDTLDRYLPTLEAEIDSHLSKHHEKQTAAIEERALRLARDILDLDEFRELSLPGGLAKRGRPALPKPDEAVSPKSRQKRVKEPPADPGMTRSPRGQRIRYEEVPFESGTLAHSRFIDGVVQANTLNPDYMEAARATESRLMYAALMIGKESIAYNDRTGAAGDFLEKLLDFAFRLQARGRKKGRRERRANDAPAARLPIAD
jgi:hypothetical protein